MLMTVNSLLFISPIIVCVGEKLSSRFMKYFV